LPSEGYNRGWPEIVRMDEKVRAKIDALFPGSWGAH
jgi:hypothetical protein